MGAKDFVARSLSEIIPLNVVSLGAEGVVVMYSFAEASGVPRICLGHFVVAPFWLRSVGLPTGRSSRTI